MFKGLISFSYTWELWAIYGDVMTQKLRKKNFACNCIISFHRIKCNTCIESFLWRASFLLPTLMSYEQYMRTLWPKSIKIWWFNRDLYSLIRLSALRDISLKPWANQHMLTLRLRWRSNWNLFTVACNCSFLVKRYIGIFYCFSNFGTILIIIKRFRFYRNLLLFFEFRYYPYYYYY